MKRIIFLALLCAALLAACAPGQPTATAGLLGEDWILVALNGQPPLAGRPPTLKLENDSIGGTSGCNSYGGGYRLQGSELSFLETVQTEMYCMDPEGIMEQERAYFDALNQVAGFTLSGDRLELKNAAGETTLVFEK
jgi:heat shock protein HslJ